MPTKALGDEEGIGVAFDADGGGGAVARVDNGGVCELQELISQGVHDLGHGAAPQIGAADTAGEKSVAGDELRGD